MFAKLSALVAGGPALNYTIQEAYPQAWGCWTHHAGVSREDKTTKVSIFKISAEDTNHPKLIAARNGVKRLKMVRPQQQQLL
jgi:SCY1-like protein 1